ncbi:death effector domain-containing protein-like isoform X2 [Acipenser ruthenus]|uniref:death effector domain-containing protein-like isoform X2 n=1 Tax=Acipenser ruthenus TaxID=7906 RepID=UPI002740F22D|nr:death effector domain-containing protein-like isoform X2 [Acipenser ruthenus]
MTSQNHHSINNSNPPTHNTQNNNSATHSSAWLIPRSSSSPAPLSAGPAPSMGPSPSVGGVAYGRGLCAWPDEAVDGSYGLNSLHRMFEIVGAQLTHRDVRVLSFLFVDVIDEYERGGIRDGRDFLLALERQGRCDETNFRHVLQLLRIITRHDLLPYVTLRRRQAVCPDPVDKYLEDTSVRYISPRDVAESRGVSQHRRTGPPPLLCCPPVRPTVCSGRGKPIPSTPNRKRKRVHSTADCREKQTCDIRLRVRAEYCQYKSALTQFNSIQFNSNWLYWHDNKNNCVAKAHTWHNQLKYTDKEFFLILTVSLLPLY